MNGLGDLVQQVPFFVAFFFPSFVVVIPLAIVIIPGSVFVTRNLISVN